MTGRNSHPGKAPQYKPGLHSKDAFYANLEDLYDKCAAHDIKISLIDFNAKIGQEYMFGPTGGQFSLHWTASPNDVRLIDFTAVRNMLICSTRFQHRDIHRSNLAVSIFSR